MMEASWRYGLYHARWQLAAFVMMLPMYIATAVFGLASTIALIPCHVIGATIFWYVDKWIFDDKT